MASQRYFMWLMLYYNDQPRAPYFPNGLVKTESDFIVWSVEAGLEKWTLVVPVISVDVYTFLAFSILTCHIKDTRNRCFLVALCRLIVRWPNLELATKRLLCQQVKKQGSCSAMWRMRVCSYSYFGGVDIPWFLGVICYNRWVFSEGNKNYFKDWCLMNSQPTSLFLTYF